MRHKTRWTTSTLAVLTILFAVASAQGQGLSVTGVGAVNRSMAGAGTAAPLDAIGAIHWNPGSISALPCNEVSFGMELLLADVDLSTTIGGVTDKVSGEAGVAPIPTIGWVHHLEDTPVTIGLGIGGIAGFKNNLPASAPLANLGLAGPAYASAEVLQLAPTLSYAINDQLSIGISPTITAATLQLDPLGPPLAAPAGTPAQGNRLHWGGGVQAGVYYISDNCVHIGFSLKSPQWFEDFRFFTDPAVVPGGVVTFDLDYPMIASLGFAYSGFQDWIFALDLRYFDWDNTDGFSEFGWKNTFAGAIAAQYHVNDRLYVRMGYNFNQNPIAGNVAALNLVDPLIQEQNVAFGASYRLAQNVDISLAYVYLVTNSLTGPLPSPPFGATDTLTHEVEAHSGLLGVTVRY